MRPSPRSRRLLVTPTILLALAAVFTSGCAVGSVADADVIDTPVVAAGLDPSALLAAIPAAALGDWSLAGSGEPVPVTLDEIRRSDAERGARYAEAGFQAGARLSLERGEGDHIAVMVDRFPHGAAHQVEDWHLSSSGITLVDGVSLVGSTAEGVMVLQDLLVRVVAVGADGAPDAGEVRALMTAAGEVLRPST